jgi:hypothetical protein
MRLGEVGDDDFVAASRVSSFTWFDELAKDRSAGFHLMFQPQHRLRDFPRPRSSQPHHANTAAARRGCDGDDSVVEIHAPIVAGTLEYDQPPKMKVVDKVEFLSIASS